MVHVDMSSFTSFFLRTVKAQHAQQQQEVVLGVNNFGWLCVPEILLWLFKCYSVLSMNFLCGRPQAFQVTALSHVCPLNRVISWWPIVRPIDPGWNHPELLHFPSSV